MVPSGGIDFVSIIHLFSLFNLLFACRVEVPVEGKSCYFFFQGLHWKIKSLKSKSCQLSKKLHPNSTKASLCSRILKTVKNLGAFFYPSFQTRD